MCLSSPQFMNGIWVPGEKQRTKAIFLSSKALDCSVPSLSNMAIHTEDFMMDDKPYARWEMKVTLQSELAFKVVINECLFDLHCTCQSKSVGGTWISCNGGLSFSFLCLLCHHPNDPLLLLLFIPNKAQMEIASLPVLLKNTSMPMRISTVFP